MHPRILAHRTGMGIANIPENSLKGLKRCYDNRVSGVECDITFTKDNEPVVWLNLMDKHLETHEKIVSEMDLKDVLPLKRTDCDEKIMQMSDIWDFLDSHPRIKIFFDVKLKSNGVMEHRGDLYAHFKKMPQEIIDLTDKKIIQPAIERRLCDRIGFVTFWGGADLLKFAKERDEKIETALILILPWIGRYPLIEARKYFPYLDSVIFGWKYFNQWQKIYTNFILRRIEKKYRKRNIKIYGGIANSKEEIWWCMNHGFDGIWTDNPVGIRPFLLGYSFFKRRKNG